MMLQRSAKEAGLDDKNLRTLQDITRPKLYPKFEWHSTGQKWEPGEPEPREDKTAVPSVYLINKTREIHHRLQASPFYVRPTQEVDVVRYGKRPHPVQPDVFILEHAGKRLNDGKYFPTELLCATGGAKLSMKELSALGGQSKEALTLEEMAAKELKRRREEREIQGDIDDDDEGNVSDIPPEEEEDEEVEDYAFNHYESEGDEDDDIGGGEPTF